MKAKLWLHPFLSPPTLLSYEMENQSDSRAPGLPKNSVDKTLGVPSHLPLAESWLLSYKAAHPHLSPPPLMAQCQRDGGASRMPSQSPSPCHSQSQQET